MQRPWWDQAHTSLSNKSLGAALSSLSTYGPPSMTVWHPPGTQGSPVHWVLLPVPRRKSPGRSLVPRSPAQGQLELDQNSCSAEIEVVDWREGEGAQRERRDGGDPLSRSCWGLNPGCISTTPNSVSHTRASGLVLLTIPRAAGLAARRGLRAPREVLVTMWAGWGRVHSLLKSPPPPACGLQVAMPSPCQGPLFLHSRASPVGCGVASQPGSWLLQEGASREPPCPPRA